MTREVFTGRPGEFLFLHDAHDLVDVLTGAKMMGVEPEDEVGFIVPVSPEQQAVWAYQAQRHAMRADTIARCQNADSGPEKCWEGNWPEAYSPLGVYAADQLKRMARKREGG